MKKFINALALLALGFTIANANAQTAPPPAAPNILQLDLGPDGSAVVEGGKVKVVSRQGDVTILSPAAPSVALPTANPACGRPPAVLSWQPQAPAPVAPAYQHVCGQGGCSGRQDLIGAVGRPVMSVVRAPFQLVGGVANVIGGGSSGCN